MNTFYDFLLTYNDFLEETSFKVLEKADMSLVKDDIREINEVIKEIKRKNNNLSSILNLIHEDDGAIKLFDIITKYNTKVQKIAVVHCFVEILLREKHISLNRIFRNGTSKTWEKINNLLNDDLLFLFSEAFISNSEPMVRLEIL